MGNDENINSWGDPQSVGPSQSQNVVRSPSIPYNQNINPHLGLPTTGLGVPPSYYTPQPPTQHIHQHIHVHHYKNKNLVEETKQPLLVRSYTYASQHNIEEVHLMVKVVFVSNPCSFFCQLVKDSSCLDTLNTKLTEAYSVESKETFSHPQMNMPCVTKIRGSWFRGKIIRVLDDTFVDVSCVDYGNTQRTPISLVKTIDQEFLDLPPQAYHCTLDVEVVSGFSEWTPQEKCHFEEVTLGKTFVANFGLRRNSLTNNFPVVLMETRPDGSIVLINNLFKPGKTRSHQQAFGVDENTLVPNLNDGTGNDIPTDSIPSTPTRIEVKPNLNLSSFQPVATPHIVTPSTVPLVSSLTNTQTPTRCAQQQHLANTSFNEVSSFAMAGPSTSNATEALIGPLQIKKEKRPLTKKTKVIECITLFDSSDSDSDDSSSTVKLPETAVLRPKSKDLSDSTTDAPAPPPVIEAVVTPPRVVCSTPVAVSVKENFADESTQSRDFEPIASASKAEVRVSTSPNVERCPQMPKIIGGLLEFPGSIGGTLYFDISDRHFYRPDRKCGDYQFLTFEYSPIKQSKETWKCVATRGGCKKHDHEDVTLESLEYYLLRWGCVLRVLSHHLTESNAESVNNVVASWPRRPLPFPIPTSDTSFFKKLDEYRGWARKKKRFAGRFLEHFGERPFQLFLDFLRQLIVNSGEEDRIVDNLPCSRKLRIEDLTPEKDGSCAPGNHSSGVKVVNEREVESPSSLVPFIGPKSKRPMMKDPLIRSPTRKTSYSQGNRSSDVMVPSIFDGPTDDPREEMATGSKSKRSRTEESFQAPVEESPCTVLWDSFSDVKTSLNFSITEVNDIIDKAPPEANLTSLMQFVDSVVEFKNRLIEQKLNNDEHHWPFQPKRLRDWIEYKKSEMELLCKISSMENIAFIAKSDELKTEFTKSQFSLVLFIPPLEEWSETISTAMEEYLKNPFAKSVAHDEVPWYMVEAKRQLIVDKFDELGNHVEINKNGNVKFFITYKNHSKKFDATYSIYNRGQVVKNQIGHLPRPPTGLRTATLKKEEGSQVTRLSRVQWDSPNSDSAFLVEYGNKNSSVKWTKKRNTSLIHFKFVPEMQIRVAVDTVVGRSEFSQVFSIAAAPNQPQEPIASGSINVKRIENKIWSGWEKIGKKNYRAWRKV